MTREERDLLFKDLCARLPYGVKAQHNYKKEIFGDVEVIEAEGDIDLGYYDEETENWKLCCTSIDNIKPYLRLMSSMTEDEKREYDKLLDDCEEQDLADYNITTLVDSMLFFVIDWLNEHHFDYRGLINLGLALEAPKGMYKI